MLSQACRRPGQLGRLCCRYCGILPIAVVCPVLYIILYLIRGISQFSLELYRALPLDGPGIIIYYMGEPSQKMANVGELPESWGRALRTLMQEEPIKADTTSIKTSIDVSTEKVNAAEHRLGNVEKCVDDLILRVNRIEACTASTASSMSCGPSYVEIRGFCKFEERDEKGIDDAKAKKALNSMKEGIDEEVKDMIRHYELVADPSLYLRVHVKPDKFDVTYCAMKV